MTRSALSVFDFLSASDAEAAILACLTRDGPMPAEALIRALDGPPGEIRQALDALIGRGWVRLAADGQADIGF